jgi:prolipoprotein diacylglyceryltransferase
LTFPLYLELGPWRLHPHLVFELLAYFVGFQLYLRDRRRRGDFLESGRRWWVIAAAAAGAAIGARLLALVECPADIWGEEGFRFERLTGKTVVGAIAGGWLAVEAAKKWLRIESRTGDLLAIPLAAAIAVGRIGCFLTGLDDHTIGVATTLPWGIDFGDGVRRHPAPLYEVLFLVALLVVLVRLCRAGAANGDLFRAFVAAYFAYRLAADFWKPAACRGLGLSAIQWVCLAALAALVPDMLRWIRSKPARS